MCCFIEDNLVFGPGDLRGQRARLEAYRSTDNGDLEHIVSLDRLLFAMKTPAGLCTASTQFGHRMPAETAEWISHALRDQ